MWTSGRNWARQDLLYRARPITGDISFITKASWEIQKRRNLLAQQRHRAGAGTDTVARLHTPEDVYGAGTSAALMHYLLDEAGNDGVVLLLGIGAEDVDGAVEVGDSDIAAGGHVNLFC